MAPRQRTLSRQGSCEEESNSESPIFSTQRRKGSGKQLTLNQTEADIARDWHDYFNLAALVFIIGTTALNYDVSVSRLELSWSGNHFWLNWATTLLYFIVDLMWVTMVPICVKSPGVIIKHHIVTMLYLIAPVFYPEYRWFMGSLLSVEINTWFLILRRIVFKTSSVRPVSPWIGITVSAMFYLTWILIRCIIYPHVLYTFLCLAVERIQETGRFFHFPMIFIPTHTALCLLNLKWTYDLFEPIVKRWFGNGPKAMVVQNGL